MKKLGVSLGFTLIELLIVISIIGVLASLLFANFSGARERARDTKRKNDLVQIKNALRLYYNDHQSYPTDAVFDPILSAGSQFAEGTSVYMKQVPTDSIATTPYTYTQQASGEDFYLTATLENHGDRSDRESQLKCGVAAANVVNYQYRVCSD